MAQARSAVVVVSQSIPYFDVLPSNLAPLDLTNSQKKK